MSTLSHQPLYVALFALEVLTLFTVLLARLQAFRAVVILTVICGAAYAFALRRGYRTSRKGTAAGRGAQLLQLALITGLMFCWMVIFRGAGLFAAFGFVLLLARNLFLTTRRALYFDLAILLALFYDAIGTDDLPYRWPIAIAFMLGLLFLLIADYTDRRLGYLRAGETRALDGVIPGLGNATFATVLALIGAAVIYVLMPKPAALDITLFPESGPPMAAADGGTSSPGHVGAPSILGRGVLDLRTSGGAGVPGASANETGTGDEAKAGSASGEDSAVLLYMRSDRPLYLRTHAYAFAAGSAWREGPMRTIKTPRQKLGRKGSVTGEVKQRFKVAQELAPRIPAAHLFIRIHYPTPAYNVSIDSIVEAETPLTAGSEYTVDSAMRYVRERPSSYGEAAPLRLYRMPPPGVSAQVYALAAQVTAGKTTDIDKALALEEYLRTHYKPAVFAARSGMDPTSQFLLEDRGGSSRQFAGALAVMLRGLGIPARIMAGYRARRLNPIHEHYEIWTTDAHHWVEAYMDQGWVSFEPTPWAVAPAAQKPESWFQVARDYVRYAREEPTDAILAGEPIPRVKAWYLYTVLVWGWLATYGKLLLLALLAFAVAAWRWRAWSLPLRDALDRLRLRFAARYEPATLVRRCYGAVERMAARRRLARARHENHSEYLERLAHERPHLAMPCRTLAVHFGVARYGRGLSAAQAQDALQAARVIAELIDESAR